MAFLSLEGIDGTGKTELLQAVLRHLSALDFAVFPTRDPPSYEPWRRLKNDVLDRENELDPFSEAFLFLSARVDNTRTHIQPALRRDEVVVADRFADSWVAYHTPRLATQLGGQRRAFDYLLRTHESLVQQGILLNPDRTILIDDDPRTALRRLPRNSRSKFEDLEYLSEVREAYLTLAKKFPSRIQLVEVKDDDLDSALERSAKILIDYLRGRRTRRGPR